MISSGLFILPGMAHAFAGPAVVISYFIAGLLALTGMLSQAELVSAMPKAGGTYFYVTRSLGPAAGTVDGLITWFSLSLKTAFALVGMATFTRIFFTVDIRITAIVLCMLFVAINIVGIKEAGIVQRLLVLGLLALLLGYVVYGISYVNVQHFTPFISKGFTAVFATSGFVFISFGGLLKVASVAEEVKNAERIVPLGMILSLVVVVIIYTLVVFVTSGVLGADKLDHSLTPITDGARAFMGPLGVIFMDIAAILAFISTANAGIMAASRYPLALSSDGLLPDIFKKLSKFSRAPYIAIIMTGVCIILALFFDITGLVKIASVVLICTFIFSCLAVIIMRESRVQNYQPKFKSPFYPWIQIVGIAGFGFLIFELGGEAIVTLCIFIFGTLFVYWFYGRIKTTREYALLHLIERITTKELTANLLETELKEIIMERDDIIMDRFDSIIENSAVIDMEEPLNLEDFFRMIADKLSNRIKISSAILFGLLSEREKETSTVIAPGIAIPHIIVDGEGVFDIIVVRSKNGIQFTDDENGRIQTAFILAGSRDERNFHLRALAAIAQVLQTPNFKAKWLSAKNERSLKDMILLSKRNR